jgi:hypothetical protein
VRKEPIIDVPSEEAKAEFDRTTEKINKIGKWINVFDRYFNGICFEWLESRCTSKCNKKHDLPDVKDLTVAFDDATIKDIDDVYGLSQQYQCMLEKYFQVFADSYVMKVVDFEPKIGRLMLDCERTPRTHSWYTKILAALEYKMPKYKAIRIIIKHHTDSIYAQDVILSMIMDTGPDLIRLLDYLIDVFAKRSLPFEVIEKMIAICVTYQEPMLPQFCLNNLVIADEKILRQLKPEHLEKFFQLQSALTAENSNRESKARSLASKYLKISQMRKL